MKIVRILFAASMLAIATYSAVHATAPRTQVAAQINPGWPPTGCNGPVCPE
jgi:hypothetical protein